MLKFHRAFKMSYNGKIGTFVLAAIMLSNCRSASKAPAASDIAGFSANNTTLTKNAAVLMTAYGSTPQISGMFEQDQANFYSVITNPAGHYGFDTKAYSQVGHNDMGTHIQEAAAKVSADGTLLVFITAHGAPSGQIQPADQAYATFGYENILANIRAARAKKGPFQRLVIVISACYSGSWLYTLSSSNDIAKQRLVMTSVDSANLSMIGSATNAVYQTFQAMKGNRTMTMEQFLVTAKSNSGNALQYSVNDSAILREPFINNPIDLNSLLANNTDVKLHALTTNVAKEGKLYLYASKEVTSLYFIDGTNQPYQCTIRAQPQENWPYICRIPLKPNSDYVRSDHDPLKMIFVYGDKAYVEEVPIEHQ